LWVASNPQKIVATSCEGLWQAATRARLQPELGVSVNSGYGAGSQLWWKAEDRKTYRPD